MLPFPGAKSARAEDISGLVFEAIARERGEAAAATAVSSCRALQELRNVVDEPPTTNETRMGLLKYLSALKFLSGHFPLSSQLDKELLWVSAFDSTASCAVANLDIDFVGVLFNLGVCEAKLGVDEHARREIAPGAAVRASQHFTAAAGAFHGASTRPTPGGARRATPDLFPEALSACESLMLGNAQQCLYDHAVAQDASNNLYHKINARYAAGAAHYYRTVASKCTDPSLMNTPMRDAIGRPAAALAAFFTAQAEISQAQICEKHCKMPEQLTRLINAKRASDETIGAAKDMKTSTLQYLHPLKAAIVAAADQQAADIRERQEKADEENRYVYHGVEPEKGVARINIREAITQDVNAAIDAIKPDARLLPLASLPDATEDSLQGPASQYAHLVANAVTQEVAGLNTAASHLREAVVQAETALAVAAKTTPKPAKEDPELAADNDKAVAAVRNAQEHGGLRALRESYSNAIRLAHDTGSSIRDIESILAAEETEDRQLRAHANVARPDSKTAAHDLNAKLTQARADIEKAGNADNVVEAQLAHHNAALQALDGVDITGAASSPSHVAGETNPAASSAVSALAGLVATSKRALGEKDALAQELEDKRHLDNPMASTARLAPSRGGSQAIEELVKTNYGALQSRSQSLSSRLDGYTAEIAGMRAQLTDAATLPDADRDRSRAVAAAYRHQAAALKFEELRAFLAGGLAFYSRQQDALGQLRGEADSFAKARSAEAARVRAAPPQAPPAHGYAQAAPPQQQYPAYAPPAYHAQQPPAPAYGMHHPYQRPPQPGYAPHPPAAPGHYAPPQQYQTPPPPGGQPPAQWHGSQPPQDQR